MLCATFCDLVVCARKTFRDSDADSSDICSDDTDESFKNNKIILTGLQMGLLCHLPAQILWSASNRPTRGRPFGSGLIPPQGFSYFVATTCGDMCILNNVETKTSVAGDSHFSEK
jgi:hypothetical protein